MLTAGIAAFESVGLTQTLASVYCSHGRVSPFASVPHPFEVVWTSSPNRNYANSGLKRLRPRRPGFGPIQKMLGSDLPEETMKTS